jgi:Mg2+ and Co2+ transporter CorA
MKIKKNLMVMNNIALPQPSFVDLRGRQSGRATFRLSPKAIEAIKQKSLFDHLIADDQSLSIIAQEVDPEQFNALNRIQKTFVISRKTLLSIEKAARQFNTPRDALVEFSIQRLWPIISRERKKHRIRKQILDDIDHYLDQGISLLEKCESELGQEDPVFAKFKDGLETLIDAHNHIGDFIAKGRMIERFRLTNNAVNEF